jgi:hypothetical protein
MLILVLVGLVAGMITSLSPCVLPVVLTASVPSHTAQTPAVPTNATTPAATNVPGDHTGWLRGWWGNVQVSVDGHTDLSLAVSGPPLFTHCWNNRRISA